jgi:hypothetical protein
MHGAGDLLRRLAQFVAEMKEEERDLRAIAAERQVRWIAGALGVRS